MDVWWSRPADTSPFPSEPSLPDWGGGANFVVVNDSGQFQLGPIRLADHETPKPQTPTPET